MRIASFDIGKKNFCFYVEECDLSQVEKKLSSVYSSGKQILWKNSDISEEIKDAKYIENEYFHNMTDLLNSHKEIWNTCDVFLIEQQLSFGRNKQNTLALKLGQHCFSYFTINYGRTKEVIEFPAYHKTKVLCAPKGLTKPQRKKWAVEKVTEILSANEQKNDDLHAFLASKKKDDYADTYLQCQAYKYMLLK